METADGQRGGKAPDFASIVPPGAGTAFYRGGACRGMGGRTEQGAGINRGAYEIGQKLVIRERRGVLEHYDGVPPPV